MFSVRTLALAVLLLAPSPAALAQFVTYSDEAAFFNGLDNFVVNEFEVAPPGGFVTLTNFGGYLDENIISYAVTGPEDTGFGNATDQDYYALNAPPAYNLGSGDFFSAFTGGGSAVNLEIATADSDYRNSLGFRLDDFDGNGLLTIDVLGLQGETASYEVDTSAGPVFFGISAELSGIALVNVHGRTGVSANPTANINVDRVVASSSVPVPGPAALPLFALGASGLGLSLRRRARK